MNRGLKAVAYHEAGHAVARIHVGAGATAVEIRPDGSGFCHGTGQPMLIVDGASQEAAYNVILIFAAGPHAEARASRKSAAVTMLTSGSDDWKQIEPQIDWLIARRFAQDSGRAQSRMRQHLRQFFKQRWPAIERVAAALLQKRFLSADEVRALAAIGEKQ